MKEKFVSNGRRCIGKRRKGGSGLAFNPQPTDYLFLKKTEFAGPTPQKTLFVPLCVSQVFLVRELDGKTRVLHCSTKVAEGGNE